MISYAPWMVRMYPDVRHAIPTEAGVRNYVARSIGDGLTLHDCKTCEQSFWVKTDFGPHPRGLLDMS